MNDEQKDIFLVKAFKPFHLIVEPITGLVAARKRWEELVADKEIDAAYVFKPDGTLAYAWDDNYDDPNNEPWAMSHLRVSAGPSIYHKESEDKRPYRVYVFVPIEGEQYKQKLVPAHESKMLLEDVRPVEILLFDEDGNLMYGVRAGSGVMDLSTASHIADLYNDLYDACRITQAINNTLDRDPRFAKELLWDLQLMLLEMCERERIPVEGASTEVQRDPDPRLYQRPDLSREEKDTISVTAMKINRLFDMKKRLAYISALLIDNAQLTKEVNEHRSDRGFEPLSTFDPNKASI